MLAEQHPTLPGELVPAVAEAATPLPAGLDAKANGQPAIEVGDGGEAGYKAMYLSQLLQALPSFIEHNVNVLPFDPLGRSGVMRQTISDLGATMNCLGFRYFSDAMQNNISPDPSSTLKFWDSKFARAEISQKQFQDAVVAIRKYRALINAARVALKEIQKKASQYDQKVIEKAFAVIDSEPMKKAMQYYKDCAQMAEKYIASRQPAGLADDEIKDF